MIHLILYGNKLIILKLFMNLRKNTPVYYKDIKVYEEKLKDEEKVKVGKENRFVSYSSVDELLADENVNTVILTVPNHLHKEMCIKAAKAGKHIITEKLAAMTVE